MLALLSVICMTLALLALIHPKLTVRFWRFRTRRQLVLLYSGLCGVCAVVSGVSSTSTAKQAVIASPPKENIRRSTTSADQAAMQTRPGTAMVGVLPEPSLEQVDTAIRDSDDYSTNREVFLKATATLAQRERLSLRYVRENGGWIRSQTHKPRPVYFTYVGGPHVSNRVYLDVSTGRLFR